RSAGGWPPPTSSGAPSSPSTSGAPAAGARLSPSAARPRTGPVTRSSPSGPSAIDSVQAMRVDVLLDPFGARWADVREGAEAAAAAGFDGVWLYAHLAGSVHRARRVPECWTALTAIAATVPGLAVGPLVLNVANRDPGTLAVMAATLQDVSG